MLSRIPNRRLDHCAVLVTALSGASTTTKVAGLPVQACKHTTPWRAWNSQSGIAGVVNDSRACNLMSAPRHAAEAHKTVSQMRDEAAKDSRGVVRADVPATPEYKSHGTINSGRGADRSVRTHESEGLTAR